jgi:HSP20 family protein
MTSKERKELEAVGKKPIETTQGESTHEDVMFVPDVDIIENSEAITLFADLPGVTRENLGIDVRDGVLHLVGKIGDSNEKLRPIYREYDEGGFSRKFTLGERIDTEKISAKLNNGVLTLVLPKAEAHKPRKIQIT